MLLSRRQSALLLTQLLIMKDIDGFQPLTEHMGASAPVSPVAKPQTSFRRALGLEEVSGTSFPPCPAVIGHRGALYAELENTIPAFLQCATWGCAGVELDVFTLTDGSVIVFHGAGTAEDPGYCTDYCIGKDGVNILDMTYEETQKLRFNPNFAEFPCASDKISTARIPLLSEVLEALRGTGLEVKIELKGPNTVAPVLKVVESLGMTGQCSYSSFDHSKLKELRKLRPDYSAYRTGALFNTPVPDDYLQRAKDCGATEIHLRYDTCTVDRVQASRKAGFRTMAWLRGPQGMASDSQDVFEDMGNEDESCYRALWETGVDQICCNRPDFALELCNVKENLTP